MRSVQFIRHYYKSKAQGSEMRRSRRRTRREDPLASLEAVRSVLLQLRRRCPELLPATEREIAKLLESVRHSQLRPDVDQAKGRPRRWPREDAIEVAQKLKAILESETGSRISLSSFVSGYLPILRYPVDIANALRDGQINVREAGYLWRLNPGRLQGNDRDARLLRAEILKVHLLTNASQESLRQRVKSALGEFSDIEGRPAKSGREIADALIEKNPYDPRHLFFDQLQDLSEAMDKITPEDLNGRTLVQVLAQIDRLLGMIRQLRPKRSPTSKRLRV